MKRDFLKVTDLSLEEARRVLSMAKTLKSEPKGRRADLLRGRSVAIVLEKASTRTRVSFEAGLSSLGAHPVVLSTQGSQLGRGEPIKDTARVLARYCDMIVYRTFAQSRLHEMAQVNVPVINALSDDGHPVQILCDIFTIEEHRGPIRGKRVAFVGDCSSNMARSWLEAAPLFDFHLVLAGPEGYMPPAAEIAHAQKTGHVSLRHDPATALEGVEIVNTDVWASMGQEDEAEVRKEKLGEWTVNATMLARATGDAIVLHCLPAHRGEEIDDATIEGARSVVWDQAENRLHGQKGLILFLLGVDLR